MPNAYAQQGLNQPRDATKSGWQQLQEAMGEGFIQGNPELACQWKPWENTPQELAYNSSADELYYGGAAGGGKTNLIIGLALTRHRRSLILRRQAVQVVEIVDQLLQFAGKGSIWRGSGHGGTMTTHDGRKIEVGGCDEEKEKSKYSGRPHDGLFFDEAPKFSRSICRYISGWNRHENPNQRCRIIYAGNPPENPEDRWIIDEFAPWLSKEYPNPAAPGELRWYTVLDGSIAWFDKPDAIEYKGDKIIPRSRTFIPAKVTDNPVWMSDKSTYISRLQALDEPLRSQLLYGDFDAGMSEDEWQVIPEAWVRAAQRRWVPTPPCEQTALGVDPARGGKDKFVIASRHGNWVAPLKKIPGAEVRDGKTGAMQVVKCHQGHSPVNVDVIGIGASTYDFLREYNWFRSYPVNNSAAAPGMTDKSHKYHFVNVRAASYWHMRELLDPKNDDPVSLPPDPELLVDLCAPRYKVEKSGYKVEKKEEIVKRIGRSPDVADAIVLSFWTHPIHQTGKHIRTIGLGQPTKGLLKLVIVTVEQLETLEIDHRCLLIVMFDPLDKVVDRAMIGLPSRVLDKCFLDVAAIDPADHQDTWDVPLESYGRRCEEIMMSPGHGKSLWKTILKKRDPSFEVIVFADNGNGLAYSAAYGVADSLRLPRNKSIFVAGIEKDEGRIEVTHDNICPPNDHVFKMTMATRNMVCD